MRANPLHLSARLLHLQIELVFAHPTRHQPRSQKWQNPHYKRATALHILEDRNLNHILDSIETPFVDLPQKIQGICSHTLPTRYQVVAYS